MERHHPAGVIDIHPAIAAASGDCAVKRVLEGTVVEGGVDTGLGGTAGGGKIGGQQWPFLLTPFPSVSL